MHCFNFFRFPKPVFAAVALHGLTDVDCPWTPAVYTTVCVLAPRLHDRLCTALFCGASLAHMAEDAGVAHSVGVHAAVALLGLLRGPQRAMLGMLAYLAAFHAPRHYHRAWKRGRKRACLTAATATAVAAVATAGQTVGRFVLTQALQRVVISHIVVETLADRAHKNCNGLERIADKNCERATSTISPVDEERVFLDCLYR